MSEADIIVIGAGMAGASVAASLAEHRKVILLEKEDRPGYHSTGRSAALFSEIYGNTLIRALARASRAFLTDPPPGFTSSPLIHPRGSLFIATESQIAKLKSFAELPDIAAATRWLAGREACEICPILREGHIHAGLLEPASTDLEVHALHQGYLRQFRARGGELLNDAAVHSLQRRHEMWEVGAGAQRFKAPVVVNAAGAWADEVAGVAGIAAVGLVPCRRTALLVDAPPGMAIARWPMVIDIDEQFYFKPDAGALLLSPADETPCPPGDAQPDEWDVAVAVERVQDATTLAIPRLRHRWAGLRTFAKDRAPVVGFADESSGFFWLAGQGGYGIQTAPALAAAATALIVGAALPAALLDLGVRPEDLAPSRPSLQVRP